MGDGVTIKEQPAKGSEEAAAFITEIDERRNYIIRKASNLSKQSHILAANVDMALLVVTIARPETSTTFIDRFLASAEAYRVPVCIAFNKEDDLSPAEREVMDYWQALYTNIGYECYRMSALNAQGIEPLRQALQGRTCWPATQGWASRHCSTCLFPTPMCARHKYLTPTARACTPPLTASCLNCPTGVRSSTFRG